MIKTKFIEIAVEMTRHGDTVVSLAKAIKTSTPTLAKKLYGKIEFKKSDIDSICKRYGKTYEELFCVGGNQ